MNPNHIFGFHALIKKQPQKHRKNTQKWSPKPWKSSPQMATKHRLPKSSPQRASIHEKLPKMCQNGVPNGGLSKSLFRHFWALGHPWAPTWPPELPKEVPWSPQASILPHFGTHVLTFLLQFTHFVHTFLQQTFYIFSNDFTAFYRM